MTRTTTFIQNPLPIDECTTFVTNRHISLTETLTQLNIPPASVIEMTQTHQDGVHIVTKKTLSPVEGVDALITQEKNKALIVRTADCLPILIYHPTVIAGIHAGRKSTDLKIVKKVLTLLSSKYGVQDNVHIYFGPHICKENYEINPVTNEHYDLRQENLNQIQSVYKSTDYTLYEAKTCTLRHSNTYYSYRKEGQTAGRFYSGIMLR